MKEWVEGNLPVELLLKMALAEDLSKNSSREEDVLLWSGNVTNYSGESGEDHESGILRHSIGWTIVLFIAYILIFIVGMVGNVMVVCVLTLRPQMKTVTNLFILNLAVADLLVNIFCVAPTLMANVLISWVLGPLMCKAVAFVQGVSVCASAYSLVAISLDRFLAIWFPMEIPRGLSKFQARVIIFCIWIIAGVIASPWLAVFTLHEKDGHTYCYESWDSEMQGKMYFIIGNLILCYALPLSVVIVSNGLIWLHVVKRKVPHESASPAAIKRVHRKTRHGVMKMLTVVTCTFLGSWLPLYVIFLVHKVGGTIPYMENIIPFAQWLGASNSSYNPILYAFLNKKFRDAFLSLMSCPNSIPGRRDYYTRNNTTTQATGNSVSLNNSTVSMTPQGMSFRQKRNTFRYPIVRV